MNLAGGSCATSTHATHNHLQVLANMGWRPPTSVLYNSLIPGFDHSAEAPQGAASASGPAPSTGHAGSIANGMVAISESIGADSSS